MKKLKEDPIKRKLWRLLPAIILAFPAGQLGAESSVWVVRSPSATVYLAGSCHVLRASDHPLPAEFQEAYADSRRLVFEAPLSDMGRPEYLARLTSAAVYSDGTILQDHVSRAAYARIKAFCTKRNYPLEQYQLFRPWMLTMTLTMMEMARIGAQPAYGVDQFFYSRAAADGKILDSLETVDQQIGFLSGMDEAMGEEQIIEAIDELEKIDRKGPEILAAWKKGDEDAIARINSRQFQNYPQLYALLFVDRNKKWAVEIESYLRQTENTMVIVGVAHLAGEQSVIDLLRRHGHRVFKLQKQQLPLAAGIKK